MECFGCEAEAAAKETEAVKRSFAERFQAELTEDYREADFAILFIRPSSGEYFHSTKGYLELDICENKQVRDVDSEGRPADSFHQETTLLGAGRIREIYESLHRRGGRVISNINFTLAWEVGNVEPCADALLAGFDTYTDAVLDVIMGRCAPTGRMPITLPKDDSVIRVDRDGICISHNDVPGYHKDKYMPESMKDENGKAYAYRDSEGNYYELDFGLTLE